MKINRTEIRKWYRKNIGHFKFGPNHPIQYFLHFKLGKHTVSCRYSLHGQRSSTSHQYSSSRVPLSELYSYPPPSEICLVYKVYLVSRHWKGSWFDDLEDSWLRPTKNFYLFKQISTSGKSERRFLVGNLTTQLRGEREVGFFPWKPVHFGGSFAVSVEPSQYHPCKLCFLNGVSHICLSIRFYGILSYKFEKINAISNEFVF